MAAGAEMATGPAKTRRGKGALAIAVLVLASIGGVAFVAGDGFSDVTRSIGEITGIARTEVFPAEGSVHVVSDEGRTTDVVLAVNDSRGDTGRRLARVKLGPGGSETVWKSGLMPVSVFDAPVVIDGDHVYVGLADEVRLLSLATGDEIWRATLTDEITARCQSCFAVVQETLVVRTDDAHLTGFEASSNEPLWSRRTNSTSARATDAGGDLLLVDDSAAGGEAGSVETLDPATGRAARRFTPSCPPTEEHPRPPTFGAGDPVVAVPGTRDLVAVFGSSSGCVVRWESASGTPRWTLSVDGDLSMGDEPPLVSDRDLVLGSSGSLVHVDLASGRGAPLEAVPDTSAEAASISGRTLVAHTTSTRGSADPGLTGWDLATGERLWSVALPTGSTRASDGPYAGSEVVVSPSARSLLVEGPTPRLVTFTAGAGPTIDTRSLDLATGELGPPIRRPFAIHYRGSPRGSVGPSLAIEDASPARVIISVDGRLQVVPLPDGDIVLWPET